jgi:hypothetical protein
VGKLRQELRRKLGEEPIDGEELGAVRNELKGE